jgi:hypothetical protein
MILCTRHIFSIIPNTLFELNQASKWVKNRLLDYQNHAPRHSIYQYKDWEEKDGGKEI